jgi:hypothetical protein
MLKIYPQFLNNFFRFYGGYARLLFLNTVPLILHTFMPGKFHLYLLIILFASCKSVKNLTARDNSTAPKSNTKNASGNTVFLDDISVTPGGKSTTVYASSPAKKTYRHSVNANKNFAKRTC